MQSDFCEMCQQSTPVLLNAVFSIIHFLHKYCVQTFFLSAIPPQICLKLHIMYGNSILLVVTEEFYGNPAQNFCNIPWQWIIAHNSGLKYIHVVKNSLKKVY